MGRYGADLTFLRPFFTFRSDDFAPVTFSEGNDPAVFAVQSVLDDMPGTYKQKFHHEAKVVTVPSAPLGYGTFRLKFHHFDRIELNLHRHTHVRGAAFSCLRLQLADIVLI